MSSEAWWTSDRNEVKIGLGIARVHKGADAAKITGATMHTAAVDECRLVDKYK